MSAIGAALQRPVDIKANPSCFKEPISDVVWPLVEQVRPHDGWAGQPVDSRALVFKRAQDLPSSLAHERLLSSIQAEVEEKEGCKAQPSFLLYSKDLLCPK